MKFRFQLLAIHNPFDAAEPMTWFSTFLRFATGSFWNHIAVKIIDRETAEYVGIIEATWPRVKWWDNYEKWERYANRTVLPLNPVSEGLVTAALLFTLIGIAYAVFDLVQLAKLIWYRRVLGHKEYVWNGQRGTGLRPGLTCAELGLTIACLPDPHLGIPGEVVNHPAFSKGEVFNTTKR